jgi:hypothetical protein
VAGEYCAACGQRVEPHIHSVWIFMREATESLTHADSRLWQSLAGLLFRPGFLTREFLDGRRARYLPPFRLYLVVSVLFFLLASLLGGPDDVIQITATEDLRAEVEQMARSADPAERAAAAALTPAETSRGCELTYQGPWQDYLVPRFRTACLKVFADGGRGLGREFMANLPQVLILFLPLIALVMRILYWRPKRYYVEHLLFFVHNHSFAFLLFALLMLISAVLPEGVGGVLTFAATLYCMWYFFRAMRVVYGQGRLPTLAKYSVLGATYLVSGVTLAIVTLAYSALAL